MPVKSFADYMTFPQPDQTAHKKRNALSKKATSVSKLMSLLGLARLYLKLQQQLTSWYQAGGVSSLFFFLSFSHQLRSNRVRPPFIYHILFASKIASKTFLDLTDKPKMSVPPMAGRFNSGSALMKLSPPPTSTTW
jgi:hypothetical protein